MEKRGDVLAIIPARGGSVSIPRKNVKRLNEIPLLAYSIEAAISSKIIDRTILSTDDEEIARVGASWGAEVPFIRPDELAANDTVDLPVFEHALQFLKEKENYIPRMLVQLRPTSPLRPVGCIDEAILQFEESEADSLRAVTPSGQNPFKMWQIEEPYMMPLLDSGLSEAYNMPRQKLPDTYWQTGHLEVIRTATITEKHSMTGDRILPFIIDPKYALDLDNLIQWQIAEILIKEYRDEIIIPNINSIALHKS